MSDRARTWIATFARRGYKLIFVFAMVAYPLFLLVIYGAFHHSAATWAARPVNLAMASLLIDGKTASAATQMQCKAHNLPPRFENCLRFGLYDASDAFLRCWRFELFMQNCYAISLDSALLQDKALLHELYARIREPCPTEARFKQDYGLFNSTLSHIYYGRPDHGLFYLTGMLCSETSTIRFVVDFVDADSGKVVDRQRVVARTQVRS